VCDHLVAYLRVSTNRQGESGLGIDAQKAAVKAYAIQTNKPILARYTEYETGRRGDRPELAKALAHARRTKASLIVAKLDRLSRNVAFLSALMESKVPFIACDNPHANKLTLHILVAMAEHEAELISKRTKDALAAAKARGQLLGSHRPGHWKGREKRRAAGLVRAREASARAIQKNARAAYADLVPVIEELRKAGKTLQDIADSLNQGGHTTRRGRPWSAMQVRRVLLRFNLEPDTDW
jgi:DNA invertase Pin-like site-specific DNA recombinase